MNKIAIVVAMQSEFELVRHIINEGQEMRIGGNLCIKGTINGKTILLMKSGIGKVNAAVQVSELIAAEHPDAIINSGVAGILRIRFLSCPDKFNIHALIPEHGRSVVFENVDMLFINTKFFCNGFS